MPIDREWSNNERVAAYKWEALRNGVIFATEYNVDGNETPLSAAFHKRDLGDGAVEFVCVEPLVFRAVPLRATLPPFDIDFAAGDVLIWLHAVEHTLGVMSDRSSFESRYEKMYFGKRLADGREQVLGIWPDGEVKAFERLQEALNCK